MLQSNNMRSALIAMAATTGIATCAAPASAQVSIGGAVAVQNDVRGNSAGRILTIAQGDKVFQNEIVRTGAASLAKMMLLDQTNVALGPASQITLDRFVYDPDAGAKQVTMSAARGAFRFISGNAPHEAYEVRTPQANIGVRGTIYDVRVESGRTTIVLQEGAVHVCRRNTRICADLTEAGQSLVVTDKSIEGPIEPERKSWDFGSNCAAANSADLCGRTTRFAFNDAKPEPARATKRTPVKTRIAVVDQRPTPKFRPRPTLVSHPARRLKRAHYALRDYDVDDEVVIRRPPRFSPAMLGIGLGMIRFGGPGGGGRGLGGRDLGGRDLGLPGGRGTMGFNSR